MFTRRIPWGAGHFQLFAKAAFALVSLTLAFSITTLAQNGQNHGDTALAAKVRALNNQLLQLHAQFQQGLSGNGAAAARSQAATVIAARAAALQSLIQQDPRAALSFAFSPELLTDLASKFPQSTGLLENNITVTGQLQQWIADAPDLKNSRSYFRMTVGSQTYDLHFSGASPTLKQGQLLKATGVTVGSHMAVLSAVPVADSGSAAPPILSTPTLLSGARFALPLIAIFLFGLLALATDSRKLRRCFAVWKRYAMCAVGLGLIVSYPAISYAQSACSTTGAQNIAVILVTFPGVTLPSSVTVQGLQDIFFNTSTGVSLDGFLRAASYGQTSATGGVFGPFTLNGTYSSCTDVGGAVTNDAVAAAQAAGVNFANYNRVFIIFPDVFGCGWGGWASVGGCTFSTTSGTYNATVAWITAASVQTRSQGVEFTSHELGHNLGLLHSGTISGGADVLGPLSSPGTETDQGDYWSTMGEVVLGLYPAPQKAEVLNWLAPTSNYEMVQSSGTYTLQPLENSPAGLQALKVQRGTGNNEWLWIEYRQAVGSYDSTLLGPEAFAGALIHYEDANTAFGHTYLPNFTPTDTTGNSPALAAGQTWRDTYTDLSISVGSATSTGLTVSVTYSGGASCISSAPTVSVSPLDPSFYAGQSASYAVSIADNDSSSCSYSALTLAPGAPSGWSSSLSSSSVTLSPGQSASVTMTVGAPTGTTPGTYPVNLNASTTSATATGTANATVLTPPTLAVSVLVSPSSVMPPATVGITATVTNGGTGVAGANVAFTLKGPTGSTTTQTATTGTNGTATWNYKLNAKAPAGTYSATAQASPSSGGSGGKKANASASTTGSTQTATSNSVSFTVQ